MKHLLYILLSDIPAIQPIRMNTAAFLLLWITFGFSLYFLRFNQLPQLIPSMAALIILSALFLFVTDYGLKWRNEAGSLIVVFYLLLSMLLCIIALPIFFYNSSRLFNSILIWIIGNGMVPLVGFVVFRLKEN